MDVKAHLHDYVRGARETLVWKLDGLGEYDIRELVDGSAGLLRGAPNTHVRDVSQRSSFFERIEAAARLAGTDTG